MRSDQAATTAKTLLKPAALLTIPILLVTLQLPAQSDPALNPGEGITVGPFIISPAIELSWERSDNVFYNPSSSSQGSNCSIVGGEPVEDDIYTARGRLEVELPFHNSYIRFVYEPVYRDYKRYTLPENISHYAELTGGFEFANGLELDLSYRYVSANLDTPEIDPGHEHVFGVWQFYKHTAMARLSYWLTYTDAIFVEGGYTDLSHDRPDDYFYDYTRESVGIGWTHQLSESARFDLRYRREELDAYDPLTYRDSTSDELSIGLTGQIYPTLTSELRVGWRETTFETAGINVDIEDYSGLSIDGFLSWELAHGSTLTLHLLRWDYPSAYQRNAYYTASGAGLSYDLNRGRLFGGAYVRFQQNEYELEDTWCNQLRTDDISMFGIRVGYWLTDWLSLRGGYSHEERESLQPYEYDANTILLGLGVGY